MRKTLLLSILAVFCFTGHSFSQNPYNADIIVAQDGSGDFTKLQAAIDASPSNSERRTVIYIKRGKYDTEKLIIPSNKKNITLIGESRDETIISYHLYDCTNAASDNKCPADAYELWKNNADLVRTSATLTIAADGFIAENLTIQNTAGPVGQALAITVTGDKGIYRNCNILGYQDTIYLWTAGKRSYFENCLIGGRTDYIYGAGIAFFQGCEIRSWGGGWITAPSTPQNQAYGYVFNQCKVTYASGSPRNGDDGAKFALGRPWHEYPKVCWLYCEMSDMINPLGWPTTWNMDYASTSTDLKLYEYKNTGAGADMSGRAKWAGIRAMTDAEALDYTVQKVMAGSDNWDPTAEAPAVKSYTWIGIASSTNSWLNAVNWNPSGVPAQGESATIDGVFTVRADGGAFAADLNLNSSAKLDITVNSEVTYMALGGGEINASSASSLSGKIQTKSETNFNIVSSLNLQAELIGVQGINKQGVGELTLSGNNSSYSGNIIINEGALKAAAANSLGLGNVTVKNGATLIFDADNAFYVKSVLKIESGAKVVLNNPVVLSELYIDGVLQSPGVYGVSTHSAIFSGQGGITVGRPTMFAWNPTASATWENKDNYKPALLPLAGDTVTVNVEMEINGTPLAATILLQKTNLRFRANAACTGDIIMSDGTTLSYATSGEGFSLDSKIKLEGDVTMQLSGKATGCYMTFLGGFEGNSKVTAYNYTNAESMIARVILSGNNNAFTGIWSAEKVSRVASSSSAFEGKAANAFGKGKIVIGSGNKVFFSHNQATSSSNELTLLSGAKATMTNSVTVGKLTLGTTEYTSGTFNATSHSQYFEGMGTLIVVAPTSIDQPIAAKNVYFDGNTITSSSKIDNIEIYSVNGKCIDKKEVGGYSVPLSLAPGLYIIKLNINGESIFMKIVC